MLGIDDFALRRNVSYGTVFVDHRSKKVIDIIDSRDPEKVIATLKKFSDASITSRDGAFLYKNAIDIANPIIIQISDKFHLIQNLINSLKQDARVLLGSGIILKEEKYDISNYKIELSTDEIKKQIRVTSKQKIIDEIRSDRKSGYSYEYLIKKYSLTFKTIKRYLENDAYQYRVPRTTEIDKYSAKIYQLLQKEMNTHQIYTEIKQEGYTSSYENFFKQLKLRIHTNSLSNTNRVSVHHFSKLIYKNELKRLKLDIETEGLLKDYLQEDNDASNILKIIESFRNLFEKKNKKGLDEWINQNKKLEKYTNLQSYIRGIEKDKVAVLNQIRSKRINNGIIEGKVCKLKAIKRRTYGRCGFHLLRCLYLLSECSTV